MPTFRLRTAQRDGRGAISIVVDEAFEAPDQGAAVRAGASTLNRKYRDSTEAWITDEGGDIIRFLRSATCDTITLAGC